MSKQRSRLKNLESPLIHLGNGQMITRYPVSEELEVIDSTTSSLLPQENMLEVRSGTPTVECPLPNRKKTSKDKSSTCRKSTQTMKSSKKSVAVSTSKEKYSTTYWLKHSKETSKRLWLPTETGCVGSHGIISNGCSLSVESISSTTVEMNTLQNQSLQRTSFQSSMFSLVDTTVKGGREQLLEYQRAKTKTSQRQENMKTSKESKKQGLEGDDKLKPKKVDVVDEYFPRAICVELLPTAKERKKIDDYIAAVRKVWNISVHDLDKGLVSTENETRNKYVFACHFTDEVRQRIGWTLRTPKRIREYAVRDLFAAIKSCETKLKKGRIKKYKIKNRSRFNSKQSIVIPYEGSKIKDGKLYFTGGLSVKMREILPDQKIISNMRLVRNNGLYYIYIPYFTAPKMLSVGSTGKIVGIDPGENAYHTFYSPSGEYGIIGSDIKPKLINLYRKEKRIEKAVAKERLRRTIRKLNRRRLGLIGDFQWKLCHWYLKRYDTIIIPRLYVSRKYTKEARKLQDAMKHCQFVDRLVYKSCLYPHSEIHECKEHYTTQACTNCRSLKTNVGDTVSCRECGFKIHRDVGASRNMVVKHIKLK